MTTERTIRAASGGVVRRARIEEVQPLAAEYAGEQRQRYGEPTNPPLPPGGMFWIAADAGTGELLGYAAGSLKPSGCTIGPIFTRTGVRRGGVGRELLTAIQRWADDTRVPVVEISVAADNEEGLSFLASLGYEPRRVLMSLTPVPTRGDEKP